MRTKKITEEKPIKINLRLTEKQFHYLEFLSESYKCSISEVIRKVLDSSIINFESEGMSYEDK